MNNLRAHRAARNGGGTRAVADRVESALQRWRAELRAGTRTTTTYDGLWEAACAEAGGPVLESARAPTTATSGPVLVRLTDVTPERVRWLWPGRIPLAKLTLLDGDPDLGKSTLLLDVAARLSQGRALPDGQPSEPCGTVILSAEDDTADTIVPRLLAAGADLTRIIELRGVRLDDYERPPVFPADLPALADAVRAVNAQCVVFDPLVAYFGDETDTWKDQSIRRALYHLKQFAQRTGVALIGMRHFTKGTSANVLHKGGGSIGLIGAARAAMIAAVDPDDPERRILAVSKSNLAAKPPSLSYRLEAAGDVARVQWLGSSPHSAAALIVVPEERLERDEAADFLRDVLATGPVPANAVRQQVQAAGLTWATVRRAASQLKVQSRKQGFAGGWAWELPKVLTSTAPASGCTGVSILGGSEHLRPVSTTYDPPPGPKNAKVLTRVYGLDTPPCVECGAPTEPSNGVYAEPLCNHCALTRGTAEVEERRREREAIQGEAAGLQVESLADGSHRVTGGRSPHIVAADGSSCDCEDHRYRRRHVCKHMRAVAGAV